MTTENMIEKYTSEVIIDTKNPQEASKYSQEQMD